MELCPRKEVVMYTAKKVQLDPGTTAIKLSDGDGNMLCYLDSDEESVQQLCSLLQSTVDKDVEPDEEWADLTPEEKQNAVVTELLEADR
jgi:hypothetical protein